VLPPGGYGTTIVTRFSGNAALQENAASARLHTKKVLVNQDVKDALNVSAKAWLKDTSNRCMISSLQNDLFSAKLASAAEIASKKSADLVKNKLFSIMIKPSSWAGF